MQDHFLSVSDAFNSIQRTIIVTEDLGTIVTLTVSRFHPQSGDATGYPWHDKEGIPKILDMPPYYISDMSQPVVGIQAYERSSCVPCLKSLLAGANPIVRKTIQAAADYLDHSKVSA